MYISVCKLIHKITFFTTEYYYELYINYNSNKYSYKSKQKCSKEMDNISKDYANIIHTLTNL